MIQPEMKTPPADTASAVTNKYTMENGDTYHHLGVSKLALLAKLLGRKITKQKVRISA